MSLPIEIKILRVSLLAAAISTLLLMLNDFYNGKFFLSVVEVPAIFFFLGMFWLTYKDYNQEKIGLITVLSAFILLAAAIVLNKGFGVGLATLFIATCAMAQCIISPKYSFRIAVFSVSLFTVLLLLDFYHPEFSNTSLFDPAFQTPKTTIVVLFYTSLLFVTWICSTLKKEYYKNFRQLSEQKKEILEMNTHLDRMVAERTHSLEMEKEKILDYAFLHSHKTRAPLSNILMMHEVLQLNKLSEVEKNDLLLKLHKEAKKLDTSIRNMQEKLQSEQN